MPARTSAPARAADQIFMKSGVDIIKKQITAFIEREGDGIEV
jgi:hypothetical protein